MTMASPCYVPSGNYVKDYETLQKLRGINLEMKIAYTKTIIQKFYIANKGKVFISFSGGKDSTVLLHIVRSIYPNVPAVYFDTGMEFPENRKFVKSFENVELIKPEMNFKEIIDKYGYPCISKEIAAWVGLSQKGYERALNRMKTDGRFGGKRYLWMIDAPFKVSADCCRIMKKKPSREYWKKTGRCPIIGTRTDESQLRVKTFLEKGENHESHGIPTSNPLSIWTDEDIDRYIARNNIKLSEAYTKLGCKRTGCMFCMFGIMNDRNRFVKLKSQHPAIWKQCMKPREEGGLGMKSVLEFMGIPTGSNQLNLDDFEVSK